MSEAIMILKDESIKSLENDLLKAIEFANGYEIVDLNTKKIASDNIGYLKTFIKKVNDKRLELTEPFRSEVDRFNNDVKKITDAADVALKALNKKFIDYTLEQERLAKAEAEAERQRQIKEQEELAAMAVNDLTEVDVEVAAQIEADALAKAEQLKQQEIVVETKSARGDNFSTGVRRIPKAKVTDTAKFLAYVIRTERFELVEIVPSALNNLAKATMEKSGECEDTDKGLKFYYDLSTTSR